jgi:hypothetical protein
MKWEYRISCEKCGLNEVKDRRPKLGAFHYPGRWNMGDPKHCTAPVTIEMREVGIWRVPPEGRDVPEGYST